MMADFQFPPPYPCGLSSHICPFTIRCEEIDKAALLIKDAGSFARVAIGEKQLSVSDPATYMEPPSRRWAESGGCPAYNGLLNAGSPATVLCQLVDVQLHSYIAEKFCEGGGNVYCPIWRAERNKMNVPNSGTEEE